MYGLLALAGLVVAVLGFFALSQATWGVGLIASGVFLAAMARIVQADFHHKQAMKAHSRSAG